MSDENIKPCPFCGNSPELTTHGNDTAMSRTAKIQCGKCGTEKTFNTSLCSMESLIGLVGVGNVWEVMPQ